MASTLESMKETCMTELVREPEFSEDGNTAIDDIAAVTCPLECSGNGLCTNGVCACNDPYTGLDCSFDSTATPEYLSITNDGLCDNKAFKDTACTFVEIQGGGFVPNAVRCSMTPITVDESGVTETGSAIIKQGNLFSPTQIICPLPDVSASNVAPDGVSGYNVQVGNNDSVMSTDVFQFVSYNSICYDCVAGTELVCTRTTSSCVIEGQCVAQGESQADDVCLLCDPLRSDSEYVEEQSMECSGMNSGQLAAIIVPTVAFAVILCVLGVIFYKRSHRNKKAYLQRDYKEEDKAEYDMQPSFENPSFFADELPETYRRKTDTTDFSDLTRL